MCLSLAGRVFALTLTLAFLSLLFSTSIPGRERIKLSQLVYGNGVHPQERQAASQGDFLVGVGRADITG